VLVKNDLEGLAWAAGFAIGGLVIFRVKTRTRMHPTGHRSSGTS
jgi:hypothetical protein